MATDWTINRRKIVTAAAGALVGGAIGFPRQANAAGSGASSLGLVSAARIGGADGGIIADGEGLFPFALPARAHAIVRLSADEVLLVGRRPGTFAAALDISIPERAPRLFAPIDGYRFSGHAALSPDGRFLATGEIDAETGSGAVVLRDSRSFAPQTSIPIGIEPHDLLFTHGGERLVVALGGIARAADVKGPPMNLGRIESALVEIDPASGAILARHVLPESLASLSLRHLALHPDGETLAFAMQDQDRSELRPLMGLLHKGKRELLPLPKDDETAMRFYAGSVAFDSSGAYLAATSPKGGAVGLWRVSDGRALCPFKLEDVCGLAASGMAGSFFATSGFGGIVLIEAADEGFAPLASWSAQAAFDNHLLRI
jgi:uncharacterized protein